MATKKVVGIDTTGKEKLGLGRYKKKMELTFQNEFPESYIIKRERGYVVRFIV
jgi:hypothetical protein